VGELRFIGVGDGGAFWVVGLEALCFGELVGILGRGGVSGMVLHLVMEDQGEPVHFNY